MDFLQFAAIHGLDIRRLDHGKITRCPTKDHPRKDNGAYLYKSITGVFPRNLPEFDATRNVPVSRAVINKARANMIAFRKAA